MLSELRHRVGFLYAERGLETGLGAIRRELDALLERPVRLDRFYEGRGWGLKYKVRPADTTETLYVVKAASRVIERRIRRTQGTGYLPPPERFRREAAVIEALAAAGMGPPLLAVHDTWFARGFVEGDTFHNLAPEPLARFLPTVLDAIDRVCDRGIFHTDINSQNVIIALESGRISFIDSEWPAEGELAGLDSAAVRRYSHRRFLFTLGRDYPPLAAETALRQRLGGLASEYYEAHGRVLDPEEVGLMLEGKELETRGQP